MKFTVFGSSGFIGSHVVRLAKRLGHEVSCPPRECAAAGNDCGHIIYCIGMTADFRRKPHQTVDAHVIQLQKVLKASKFETFTYLSSTRIYQHCSEAVVSESSPVAVHPQDPGDLYNLSKMLGESLLLHYGDMIRVARLSNVIGDDGKSGNFLSSVLRDCVFNNRVRLHQSLESAKDYISIEDVVSLLLRLGPEGRSSVYNVASGVNITHQQICDAVAKLTGAAVEVSPGAPLHRFPEISTERIRNEFQFRSRDMIAHLPALLQSVQQHQRKTA